MSILAAINQNDTNVAGARFSRVANRLTRVPQSPPPLDAIQLRLLPAADLFMALMFSRPRGLSLRSTWVTPATIWLCCITSVGCLTPAVVLLVPAIRAGNLPQLGAGLLAVLVAVGAGSVGAYGIRQRLLASR